jgi:putative acetyltransferase
VIITVDDPRSPGVLALLDQHRRFAQQHTPPGDVHVLDVDGLLDPAVTLYSISENGTVLAIGALKNHGDGHLEIKSMHTAVSARRRGIGRAMLHHLLSEALVQGATRVSLETGSNDAFAAARALYADAGFEECEPFGTYPPDRSNTFMTLALGDNRSRPDG